jgi:hypothetical protein
MCHVNPMTRTNITTQCEGPGAVAGEMSKDGGLLWRLLCGYMLRAVGSRAVWSKKPAGGDIGCRRHSATLSYNHGVGVAQHMVDASWARRRSRLRSTDVAMTIALSHWHLPRYSIAVERTRMIAVWLIQKPNRQMVSVYPDGLRSTRGYRQLSTTSCAPTLFALPPCASWCHSRNRYCK